MNNIKSQNRGSEFMAWCAMRYRCYTKTHYSYYKYGARGITVCDRWRYSFQNFLADMGYKPTPKHSIDRINNDGNYEPANCRWATSKEQMANTRQNHWIDYNGERLLLSQWAKKIKTPLTTILYHLNLGRDMKYIIYHFEKYKHKRYRDQMALYADESETIPQLQNY